VTTQGDIVKFLNNAENAQKLNDLVDDIHEALLEYQVNIQNHFLMFITTYVFLRLPYNKTSTATPAS
jgi:hypothetical protein